MCVERNIMTKLNTRGISCGQAACENGKLKKCPCLNLSNCDQSSPEAFSSPSPFFSGDALPLVDPLDFDLKNHAYQTFLLLWHVTHLDLLESPFSFMGDPDRDFESLLTWNIQLEILSNAQVIFS